MSAADVAAEAPPRLPPALGGGLPVLGHVLEFRRDPVGLLGRGRARFGDVFSFRLAGRNVAVLTGPRASEAFFRAPDDQLSARPAYQFTVPIFGEGVAYDAPAERMEEQLALIVPAMAERRMRTYAEAVAQESEAFTEAMGDEGEAEILELTNELTVFIASRCLIGREFREGVSAEFARLYKDLEGGINLLAFFHPHLPLPSFRRRDRARRRMAEILSEIIAARRSGGGEGEDFLQTLMTSRYGDGTTLSDDNITGLLLTLVFAGQHTSAVLAAWTGVELLRHPEYLSAVLREQHDLFGDRGELTYEAIHQMGVLGRAVQEAERLHPPLIMLMRHVLRDFTYGDFRVPAGWLAMVTPAVSHRIAEVFADPDRYDPDRFGPGREEHRKSRFALTTFGGGRHACIGMMFAYLQVRAIWSVLLRRFEWELVDGDPEPDYATFVVGPRKPCRVRFRRRGAVG